MPDKDYLKYWRVIRYYVQARYELSTPELEMLLFLYSEKYFDRDKFSEFDALLSWNKGRFEKLRKDGWMVGYMLVGWLDGRMVFGCMSVGWKVGWEVGYQLNVSGNEGWIGGWF